MSGAEVIDESSSTVGSTSAANAESVAAVNEDKVGRVRPCWGTLRGSPKTYDLCKTCFVSGLTPCRCSEPFNEEMRYPRILVNPKEGEVLPSTNSSTVLMVVEVDMRARVQRFESRLVLR